MLKLYTFKEQINLFRQMDGTTKKLCVECAERLPLEEQWGKNNTGNQIYGKDKCNECGKVVEISRERANKAYPLLTTADLDGYDVCYARHRHSDISLEELRQYEWREVIPE